MAYTKKPKMLDNLLYSDPQHMIFAFSPNSKHIRLLELEKNDIQAQKNSENDFFRYEFTIQTPNNQQSALKFIPKRCHMLDSQLRLIEKQKGGKPLSYKKKYKQLFQQKLKSKIFTWQQHQPMILNANELIREYYSYEQINNFCFGRKHFVRAINSIELSSDHISRSHCEIIVKKAKCQIDVQRYFGLLFGTTSLKPKRISQNNILSFVPMEIWFKIYDYIFSTTDKYFIIDNGSRNGTFFIEYPLQPNFISNNNQPINNPNIISISNQSHRLKIKEGFSYEFQGEDYMIKAWRMTQESTRLKGIQSETRSIMNLMIRDIYLHNSLTISYIKEFEQKVNWFTNFQKVSKEYLIDENLLERRFWKDKIVYKRLRNMQKKMNGKKQTCVFNDGEEFNNNNENETEYISKSEFIKLLNQEYLVLKKMIEMHQVELLKIEKQSLQNQHKQSKNQLLIQQLSDSSHLSDEQFKIIQQMLINKQKLNVLVLTLEFNNDFKRLYCIITQTQTEKKYHLGFQMIINTTRNDFQQENKCNGYIHFDGYIWSIVAFRDRQGFLQQRQREKEKKNYRKNFLGDSEDSFSEEENQPTQDPQQQSNYKIKQSSEIIQFNLNNRIRDKIWTKIPAKSQYQINPRICAVYLLRLAHSFYFQLKFINFNNQKTK